MPSHQSFDIMDQVSRGEPDDQHMFQLYRINNVPHSEGGFDTWPQFITTYFFTAISHSSFKWLQEADDQVKGKMEYSYREFVAARVAVKLG